MKNKLLRRKALFNAMLIGTLILSVTGCGKDSVSTESIRDESESTEEVDLKKGFAEETSLSQCFKTDAIWYYLKDDKEIGKDTYITKALVIKDGKVDVYNICSDGLGTYFTLGEAAKLSDEEMLIKLKELRENYWEAVASGMFGLKDLYQTMIDKEWFEHPIVDRESYGQYCTYDFTSLKDKVMEAMGKMTTKDFPEANPTYTITAKTDNTGNYVEEETISISGVGRFSEMKIGEGYDFVSLVKLERDEIERYMETINKLDPNGTNDVGICSHFAGESEDNTCVLDANKYAVWYYAPTTDGSSSFTITGVPNTYGSGGEYGAYRVYDSEYSGYFCGKHPLVTRVNSRVNFSLDTVKTEGIELD